MSEEWAKEASKRGELPDLEDLVKFFWKRQSAMNALVPVNTAPKKPMSTRPQHVKSAAPSKAVHHVSSLSSSRFNCPSRFSCRHCGARHHSTLHKGATSSVPTPKEEDKGEDKVLHASSPTTSLLSTAMTMVSGIAPQVSRRQQS